MAAGSSSLLLRFIRKLAAPRAGAELSEGELLERFIAVRDESAFVSLVQRHGPMVLTVCRSILNDSNDAEDAFQATFLVLVRKARSIGKPDSLGSWLHGVAYRLSLRARGAAARRRTQESKAPTMSSVEPEHEAIWRDLQPLLHEEVDRLPERYRKPFVLCYLEGRTNEEAAQILGWPKGTVLSSLARARDRLRERLTRRGVALPGAALTALLAQQTAPAAVPIALVEATVRLAAGAPAGVGISASMLAHAHDLLHAMFLGRVMRIGAVVLLTATVLTSAGLIAHRSWTDAPPPPIAASPQPQLPASVWANDAPEPAPPPREKSIRPDRELIVGAWIVVAGERAGQPIDEFVKGDRLIFSKDDFSMNAAKGEAVRLFQRGMTTGRYRLDTASQPRRIELIDKTRTLHGIYQVENDTLKICLSDPEERELPNEFASKADDRSMLLLLKRP